MVTMQKHLLASVAIPPYLPLRNSWQDAAHTQRIKIMAVIETTRSAHASSASFGLGLTRLFAAYTAWKDARDTRNALYALSDRELEDIGLTRVEIADFTTRT